MLPREPDGSPVAALGVLLLALVFQIVALVAAYRLAVALGWASNVSFLIATLMVVPCVSLIVVIVLISKATSWCKAHRILVGVLGPTRNAINELRRQGGGPVN
jgi:hypothetical protein